MPECSRCGKKEMTFKCRYCEKKFCSEHRLPENHDCEGLEDAEKGSGEPGGQEWFQNKEPSSERVRTNAKRKKGIAEDLIGSLTGNVTYLIIAVTTASFFLQAASPRYLEQLILQPGLESLIAKPWTVLTVLLAHGGLFHLFANMLTLYFFGSALEKILDLREMLGFYIGTGLLASIGYVLFRNVLFQVYGPMLNGVPTLSPAVGASGAVVAVFAATAVLYPDAEVLLYFIIPMKIGTALKLFAGIELLNLATKAVGWSLPVIGISASSAHLTGLFAGLYFGRKIRERRKSSAGFQMLSY